MARDAGEMRKREAVTVPVPAPVVTGESSWFSGYPPRIKETIGMEYLVAWFVCFHGLLSAVVLAILAVALDRIDAYHHICQDGACLSHIIALLANAAASSSGVEMLAAMLNLALLFTGWSSRVLSFWSPLVVINTAQLSVRLLYVALSGSFGGDIVVKAAVAAAVIVIAQLALCFWGAKVVVPFDSIED